ncbi:MAG TPA: GNAT family N-acetyltransferase [Pyrinomonadaceae bacterium]|jgi:predicted acetyltransferase
MTENVGEAVLVELNAGLKNEFLAMAKDYEAAGESVYQFERNDFDEFLERLERLRIGKNLPAESVRSNTFFLLVDGKFAGMGFLRHELNEKLAVYGGHIGYDVSPSERRKGYGTMILRLTLEKACAIGLKRVFLTCDADHAASSKIIEKCGGRLENQIFYEPTGKLVSQYWIEL